MSEYVPILSEIYAPCKLLKSYVHHYGYVLHNEQEFYEKSWRNINLLMQMVKEEPDNVHWREQVVQEFANSHDYGRLYTHRKVSRRLLIHAIVWQSYWMIQRLGMKTLAF